MKPTLQKVEVENKEQALNDLIDSWVLPDGTEVVDKQSYRAYVQQLNQGYFYRLVWPRTATLDDILEWHTNAAIIVQWHKWGLV